MTTPDTPTLDERLKALVEDAETEAKEAKAEFEAAKARHETARDRAKALRTAVEAIEGTTATPRPPDAANGEAVDSEHFERVKEARETVPAHA